MKRFVLFLLVLMVLAWVQTAKSIATIQEVIVQAHDNAEFPAVSSPNIAVLPNGTLLAVFCNGSVGGIYGKMSNDNGESWTEYFTIKSASCDYKAYSSNLLVSGNDILLFYIRVSYWNDTTLEGNSSVWKLESLDNGQSWTNEARIDEGNHNYTLVGSNSLRMRNGTLIVPISWSASRNVGGASVLRSDDDGLTWYEGGAIPYEDQIGEDTVWLGLDEPAIVELSNGSLYCLLRTWLLGFELSTHLSSISNDYGLTWSLCRKVEKMYAYNTTPAIFRYSWNPNIVIAAWINRSSRSSEQESNIYLRRPLVVAYSIDDCNTWRNVRVVDPGVNNDSMNEPSFVSINQTIIVGYRRYAKPVGDTILSDAVTRRITLAFFLEHDSFVQAFASKSNDENWNVIADLNFDGIIDIFDAVLFAK